MSGERQRARSRFCDRTDCGGETVCDCKRARTFREARDAEYKRQTGRGWDDPVPKEKK